MQLITLSDLHQIRSQFLPTKPRKQHQTNSNLQLVIRQLLIGLPVQPLLDAYPQVSTWVREFEQLAPELKPNRILIDTPLVARLSLNQTEYAIHVSTKLGFKKGIPKLYEWRVGSPQLSWQDKTKLWVAAKNYHLSAKDLQKLRFTIIAFSSQTSAERQDSYWSLKNHKQTQRWLKETLRHQSAEQQPTAPKSDLLELLDVNAIEEIAI